MQTKRASRSAERAASQNPSPKEYNPVAHQVSPESRASDSDSAALIQFYNAFLTCRNEFDTWMDSSVPQKSDAYFHTWEQYGAGVSVRLYQLMDDCILDSRHLQPIYKGVCAMQMHLGRRRAEQFFCVNACSLNQSIPCPNWGQLKCMVLTDSALTDDHFNDAVSVLRNETGSVIEDWGGLGETRRYGKLRHMERTVNLIEELYIKWRDLLDDENLVGVSIDGASLVQEASHTLFVLGETLERVTFALSHKNLYPLRRR
jgi:hypothetical protein